MECDTWKWCQERTGCQRWARADGCGSGPGLSALLSNPRGNFHSYILLGYKPSIGNFGKFSSRAGKSSMREARAEVVDCRDPPRTWLAPPSCSGSDCFRLKHKRIYFLSAALKWTSGESQSANDFCSELLVVSNDCRDCRKQHLLAQN